MAYVTPLTREALQDLEPVLAASEAMMGFVPNSMLTMAHMPQLSMAFSLLAGTVFGADLKQTMAAYADKVPSDTQAGDNLSPGMVQLIAYSVSTAAGCRYCQAHTSHNAHRFGVSDAQLADVLNYAESDAFDPAEKAVVAVALSAGEVPIAVTAEHFAALAEHFSERQIVQVVAVISLFGFLNRWNDTMATALEEIPSAFAESRADATGWQVGKHGAPGIGL